MKRVAFVSVNENTCISTVRLSSVRIVSPVLNVSIFTYPVGVRICVPAIKHGTDIVVVVVVGIVVVVVVVGVVVVVVVVGLLVVVVVGVLVVVVGLLVVVVFVVVVGGLNIIFPDILYPDRP